MSKQVEFVLINNLIELQIMPADDKSIIMHHSRVLLTINKAEKEKFIKEISELLEKYNAKKIK